MRTSSTIRILIISLCMLPGTIIITHAHAQTISVALPDTFVTDTQSVMIPVVVSDVSTFGIISFQFTISYDETIIEIEDAVALNGIASGFLFLNNLDLDGKVFIAAAGVDTLSGSGTLFYLQASFLQDGVSEMNFDVVDFEVESAEVVAQNGRVRNISLANVDEEAEVPTQTLFTTNYPNPFYSSTTISMDLPEAAQVSVELYNIAGQLEGSYPPRPIAAGSNQLVTIEASSLPTGSYYYRVIAHSLGITRYGTGAMTIIH